jgi:CelD/BcsL family acetyltransferase involved in cellulose biosynthesis
MQVQRARTTAELAALRDDWNRLSNDVPFRCWEWNNAWWQHYGQPHELFVLAVYDDARLLVGVAPWYCEQTSGAGRVLRFLGSGEVCSDYTTVLAAPGSEPAVCAALVDWLTATSGDVRNANEDHRWDLLELTGVDAADDVITGLGLVLTAGEFTVHERGGENCWRIPLPASWEDYLAMLSKPNRRRVRWAEKQLRENNDLKTTLVTNPSEFDFAWQALVELHQRRRRSLGQPGCFASEPFGLFLQDISRQFLNSGRLHMVCVEHSGRPIAAGLNFCGGSVTYAYQVGIDPDSLHENPGWLVNTACIRHAIANGQRGFDFLRGDEPYKGHLRALARPSKEIRFVPNRLRSQLWHTAWLTGSTMKDWLKNSLTLAGIRAQ